MSETKLIEQYYGDTPFSDSQTTLLKSKFLEFGEIWSLSIGLIKNNFQRAFLLPVVWQMAVYLVGFIVLGSTSLSQILSYIPSVSSGLESYDWSSFAVFTQILLQSLLVLLVCSIVVSLISLRQYYILNHKSVLGIWQTDRGFYIDLLKIIGIGCLYFLILTLIYFFFYTFDPAGNLADLAVRLAQAVLTGLFGLYLSLIVLEQQGIINSLKISLNTIKPIFWKNVVRWLIFNLITIGFFVLIGIILIIFSSASYYFLLTPSIDMAASEGTNLAAIVLTSIFAIFILGIIGLIIGFLSIFQTAFGYVSFINIRLLSLNHESKELMGQELRKDEVIKEVETSLKVETPVVVETL